MRFDQMPLPNFHGRRDCTAPHIRAIIDSQSEQHDAHVDLYLVNLDEESDQRAWEARQEEDGREYLKQQPCYDDKDNR
jgi:alkyl hydroperoxide reductase subunit AhpC